MEYSDIKAPTNFIPYLFYRGNKYGYDRDKYEFLAYYGYLGKNPQNLVKKMVLTLDRGTPSTVTEEYEYNMKDGLPIEILVKKTDVYSDHESIKNFSIVIEWN